LDARRPGARVARTSAWHGCLTGAGAAAERVGPPPPAETSDEGDDIAIGIGDRGELNSLVDVDGLAGSQTASDEVTQATVQVIDREVDLAVPSAVLVGGDL
jgi:hypothetical protein